MIDTEQPDLRAADAPDARRSIFRGLRPQSRTGWIGIDIGSHCVKLAQLELVSGRKQIAEAMILPIPASASLTPDSVKTGWLAQTLRDELSRGHGFRGRRAACVLSMNATELRSLDVPSGSHQERRAVISLELADSAVGGPDSIEFDFWDADANQGHGAPGINTVNVVSVSNRLATAVAEALRHSGLRCRVLDGGPFAMARAVQLAGDHTPGQQPAAILDWGHQATHFAVVIKGQPVFSRLFKDCGMDRVLAGATTSFGLSAEDCRNLLSTHGVPNESAEIPNRTQLQALSGDVVAEMVSHLVCELERTLSYLKTQRDKLVPTCLWLVGGGASIRNLETRLSREIGMPVMPWRLTTRDTSFAEHPVGLFAQAAALSDLGWAS